MIELPSSVFTIDFDHYELVKNQKIKSKEVENQNEVYLRHLIKIAFIK